MAYQSDYYDNYLSGGDTWRNSLARRSFFYRAMTKLIFRHQPDAATLVEVGCGIGMFTFTLAQRRPDIQIIAGDISDHALAVTASHLRQFPSVRVKQLDAEALSIPDAAADVLTAFDVLEHLQNPDRLISEAFRVLKPNGIFVFTTPNPKSLGARIKRTPNPPGDDNSPDTWFAFRDATHVSIRPISSWRALCATAGFQRISDGSDFWWDTPYLRKVPLAVQKIIFNGSHRLLTKIVGFASWSLGENYVGVWRKPDYPEQTHVAGRN